MLLSGRDREVRLFACGMVALALLCGCGDDNPLGRRAISGDVTLDGAPLANGAIEFHPLASGGAQSGGPILNGRYEIPEQQGVPVGEYRVLVFATEEAPPLPADHMPGEDVPEPKSLIPPEWNQDSTQTIEVAEDGPSEFDFNITTTQSP